MSIFGEYGSFNVRTIFLYCVSYVFMEIYIHIKKYHYFLLKKKFLSVDLGYL